MEAAGSSETLLPVYRTAQSCISRNQNLHTVFIPTYKMTHLHNVYLQANTYTEHEVPALLYGRELEINNFLYSVKYSFSHL